MLAEHNAPKFSFLFALAIVFWLAIAGVEEMQQGAAQQGAAGAADDEYGGPPTVEPEGQQEGTGEDPFEGPDVEPPESKRGLEALEGLLDAKMLKLPEKFSGAEKDFQTGCSYS